MEIFENKRAHVPLTKFEKYWKSWALNNVGSFNMQHGRDLHKSLWVVYRTSRNVSVVQLSVFIS